MPVRIELHVRRYFCDTTDCPQRIFTERLPKTVNRYARRTCRLSSTIEQIALALGGAAGSRLARQLGIVASGCTFLRQLRRKAVPVPARGPRVLGSMTGHGGNGIVTGPSYAIWSEARSSTYCLIAARRAQNSGYAIIQGRKLSAPVIEPVLYAAAATKAAPQAIQVADRWHLLHNLSEAFVSALVPYHVCSPRRRALRPKSPKNRLPPLLRRRTPPSRLLACNAQNRRSANGDWYAIKP